MSAISCAKTFSAAYPNSSVSISPTTFDFRTPFAADDEFVDRHPDQIFIVDHLAEAAGPRRRCLTLARNMRELAKAPARLL